ncbi:Holliday junction resolvase RecU [Garciella nitratireducens]|uniref:Holliday junction resolvase RecU n=1 Tax=Garciella nitratireducens DSM 15102 TaxID=1121911 RepID=A0A1T4KK80_9FIRM|nr:Holliday junction resolvase RecU [Garciella nitratireducens]SJZ42804.1 recombination protein U [Garciella nitratireducens DSM 15102]
MAYWNSRGLRGNNLEELINLTNETYLKNNLAVIQKIPTSIKPVEFDKSKGVIKLAYFEQKSTVDYMGNVQGIPICFDAKETTKKNLPISNIHAHQIEFMENFTKQKGVAFIIVYFHMIEECYLIPFEDLKFFWQRAKKGGKKSISYKECNSNFRIFNHKGIFIHYLETLNKYLMYQQKKKGENLG